MTQLIIPFLSYLAFESFVSISTLKQLDRGTGFSNTFYLYSCFTYIGSDPQVQFLASCSSGSQHVENNLHVTGTVQIIWPALIHGVLRPFSEEHCYYPHFINKIAAEKLIDWPKNPVNSKARIDHWHVYSRNCSLNVLPCFGDLILVSEWLPSKSKFRHVAI